MRDARAPVLDRNQPTDTSVDGTSEFDLISQSAMLEGLLRVEGGSSALPFVRMFYGTPSEYSWEDATGTVHTILQGEGCEQVMPSCHWTALLSRRCRSQGERWRTFVRFLG